MAGFYRQSGKLSPCRWQTRAGICKRHRRYLKEHRKATYATLLTSGKLNAYLADIDEQAEKMFSRLVKQMAEKQGITEQMKAENQMLWVGRMNNIRSAAMEIVTSEMIYN